MLHRETRSHRGSLCVWQGREGRGRAWRVAVKIRLVRFYQPPPPPRPPFPRSHTALPHVLVIDMSAPRSLRAWRQAWRSPRPPLRPSARAGHTNRGILYGDIRVSETPAKAVRRGTGEERGEFKGGRTADQISYHTDGRDAVSGAPLKASRPGRSGL